MYKPGSKFGRLFRSSYHDIIRRHQIMPNVINRHSAENRKVLDRPGEVHLLRKMREGLP